MLRLYSLWRLCTLLLLFISFAASAQVPLAGWDFNPLPGGSNNFGPSPQIPTFSAPNTSVGFLFRGAGVSTTGTGAARGFGGVGFNFATAADAINNNRFFTFTINANSGYSLSLSSINPFDYRRSGTGATQALIQYAINAGPYTDITTVSFPSTATTGASAGPVDLSTVPGLQNLPSSSVVYFRIVPFGASGATGTWYFFDFANSTANDFVVNGTVAIASSLTATALSFPTICPNTTNVQSTSVSGSGLNGSNVVIGPFSGFGFSLNPGGPFDPTLSLSYVGTTLPATTVYVQYAPSAGGSNSGNIPMSGGGTNGNIATTANAFALPLVSASAIPGSSICSGAPVTLHGSGASTYSWNGNPTLTSDTLLNPASAGTYTVVGVDGNSCSASSTVTITVLASPVVSASASAPNPVCGSSPVTLQATGAASYTWNGIPTTGSDTTLSPASAGTYTVVGTAANGCTGSATIAVSITSPPGAPTAGATPTQYCVSGSSNLLAISAGNNILWYDAPVGGTLLTTLPSGTPFSVGPGVTTTYYAAAAPPVSGSQTFTFTGAPQTFTVPAGVTSLTLEAWGAQGGSNPLGIAGGLGGYATGTLSVTPGAPLTIYVGGTAPVAATPSDLNGGFNGGGSAGTTAAGQHLPRGGGGGGASDIRYNGNTLAERVLVAAGGGGAAGNRVAAVGRGTGGGGGGGYYGGGGGAAWLGSAAGGTVSTGGSQLAGGLGGVSTFATNNNNGFPGSLGQGGQGGPELSSNQAGSANGALGAVGGGLIGADGLYNSSFTGGSGAGGSSYIGGVTSGSTQSGIRSGNGQVVISWTGSGCASLRSPVTVTVNPAPSVTGSASPSSLCLGGSTVLNGGGASSYTWTDGANTPANGTSFSPSGTGTSTYTVTGTDGNGCTATSTVSLTVNGLPTVGASTNAPGNSVCTGGSLDLIGSNAVTYNWQPGSLSGSTVTVSPVAMTTYTVTGSDANGCSATSTVLVGLLSLPTVTATASPSTICLGSSSSLTGAGAVTYSWNPGGLSGNPTVTPTSTTVYTVTGTDALGCSATATLSLGVANATPPGTTGDTRCGPGVVNLSASGNPSATLLWYDNPTGGTSVNTGNLYTPNLSATDTFYVEENLPVAGTTVSYAAGKPDNSGGGGQQISTNYVIFDVLSPSLTLDSVTVYPGNTGPQTVNILLTNSVGAPLQSIPVPINPTVAGNPLRIPVGMTIPNGTGYHLGQDLAGISLFRNSGGVTYPYTVPGVVSVTNSAAGNTFYYFFYDWKVTVGSTSFCVSTRTPVIGTVNPVPVVNGSITPTTGCQNTGAIPSSGGTAINYSWSGGIQDGLPFLIGAGSTTYTVTGADGNNCTATSSVTVTGTPGNNTLPGATASSTQNQGDDLALSYYDGICNPIAIIDDGLGGNILGLTTATVNVQGTAGFHNGQPFVRRWYQITPTSNGAADVQLYISQADFDDYNAVVTAPYLPLPTGPADVTGIANVRITKNADAGLGNSPAEITPTVSWNGSYWVLSFSTPSFSQFRVHSANPGGTPLPVTLTNFDGRKLNSSNLLEWSTSAELNNAYFNLQYSTNGTDFTTIAKVDSKAPNGLSATKLNYSYEHNTPALGHNYYRLQQVDLDGNSTQHAKVVDLIWGANGSTVSLYPNPTKDVLNIDLYTTRVQNTTVKVLDMSGRIVKQIQARSEAGMNKLSISLGDIASGVYTVQVFENDVLSHVGKVELSK